MSCGTIYEVTIEAVQRELPRVISAYEREARKRKEANDTRSVVVVEYCVCDPHDTGKSLAGIAIFNGTSCLVVVPPLISAGIAHEVYSRSRSQSIDLITSDHPEALIILMHFLTVAAEAGATIKELKAACNAMDRPLLELFKSRPIHRKR